MPSGGGSSGNTTTVQKSDPWSGQQPYLTGGTNTQGQNVPGVFNEAANLYSDRSNWPQFFPGDIVANFTPTQTAAQNLTVDRALGGNPAMNAATQNLSDTEGGGYLSAGNPYFQNMLSNSLSSVLPSVDAQFGGSGNAFSSARNNAITDAAMRTAGTLGYQNYSDERNNQMKGMLFAPQIASQDYVDLGNLANVGAQQQGQNQAEINADVQRFNYNQQLPANMLAQYQGFVNGSYGGTGTTTQPYFSNNSGTNAALGAGLGGGAAYLLGASNPWIAGAAIGGGLLGSMFN